MKTFDPQILLTTFLSVPSTGVVAVPIEYQMLVVELHTEELTLSSVGVL